MTSEIDRFIRQAQLDPRHTRSYDRGTPPRLLTAHQKRLEVRKRVESVLVLLFNDPLPYERLTVVCGRDYGYWRRVLSLTQAGDPRLTKDAIKLLTQGLRAHIMGVRDHLADVEAEIVRVTDALDEPGLLSAR